MTASLHKFRVGSGGGGGGVVVLGLQPPSLKCSQSPLTICSTMFVLFSHVDIT